MDPAQGGVVEAINQAAMSFNNDSFQTEVLCLDDPDSEWVKNQSHYTIHALGEGITAYGFHRKYLSWLWQNSKNYDVIIIDGLWQFLVLGGYILKILNVPYCVFTHGMLDPYFNKEKLKFIKKLPFWFGIERNVIALASAVIFTCRDEYLLASNSFPLFRAREKITTLGVEGNSRESSELVSSFYTEFPTLANKKFAIFLSRINKKKGIDLLVGALGRMKNLPEDFQLAIAGPDSEGLQLKLTQQIELLGLTDRVVWLGMLKGDVKWGAYHASEVFILPSHQENFGIVVAEALSTGTPVLITNKVNIWREVITAGAGFVENDDIDGVEELLSQWFSLGIQSRRNMKADAITCFQKNFSIDASTRDLERVLLNVSKSK